MKIDDKNLDQFCADFTKAVEALQEKYGVTIELGNITYWEEYFTAKMTVTNGRSKVDTDRVAFDANVWRYEHLGFRKGMYLRKFIGANGRVYAVYGFNNHSKKYPICVIDIKTRQRSRAAEGFVRQILSDTWEPEENDEFITLQ